LNSIKISQSPFQMGNVVSCVPETRRQSVIQSSLLRVQRLEGPDIPNLHSQICDYCHFAFCTKVRYDFRLAEIQDLHQERGLPVVNEKDIQRHCHEHAKYALLESYFYDFYRGELMKFPEIPTRKLSSRPQLYDVYEMSVRHKEWLLRQKIEATCQKEYLRANFGRS